MSIESGYFLAGELALAGVSDTEATGVALQDYEDTRRQHTKRHSQQAYMTGKVFHRLPAPLRPLRDLVYDHTPLLQKVIGDETPASIVAQLDEIDAMEARLAAAGVTRTLPASGSPAPLR